MFTFKAWTTRVSNPLRSPRFRVSASDTAWKTAFASGVLPNINAFHRYTGNSVFLCCPQAYQYRMQLLIESEDLTLDLTSRLHSLYAQ